MAQADGGRGEPPLVAFDFDGTLTVADSYSAFLSWRAGPARWIGGLLRLAPAGLRYAVDRDRQAVKAAATAEFLRGVSRAELERDAQAWADSAWDSLLRPDALAAWRRWKAEGARLLIVTASLAPVVAPFAQRLGADGLVATEFAFDANDRLTGGFASPNCRGPEKVVRLKALFGPGVRLAAAYGDSDGDRDMLRIAEAPGYKVFRQRP